LTVAVAGQDATERPADRDGSGELTVRHSTKDAGA
jgi:hypothetical protein